MAGRAHMNRCPREQQLAQPPRIGAVSIDDRRRIMQLCHNAIAIGARQKGGGLRNKGQSHDMSIRKFLGFCHRVPTNPTPGPSPTSRRRVCASPPLGVAVRESLGSYPTETTAYFSMSSVAAESYGTRALGI